MEIKLGDKLKVIFDTPIKRGEIHQCLSVYTDEEGYDHIDIGLERTCNYITGFESGETLPGKVHWCHPNRFIVI
jgi:hypothetical protein